MATVILIDAGYFVGRMQKHWSPKGKMRRAHNQFKSKKINWFQRQYHFQKALNSDLGFLENASQSEIRQILFRYCLL